MTEIEQSISTNLSEALEEIAAVRTELGNEKFYRNQSATRTRIIIVSAVAILVLFSTIGFLQSRQNGKGLSLLRECVVAPKSPSSPGQENCYERSQLNEAGAIKILADDFDRIVQLRDQELLNAINSGQKTIVFAPAPTLAPPRQSPITTVPRTTITAARSSGTTNTTTTTTAKPPSTSTTSSTTTSTTECSTVVTVDGVRGCKP